MDLEENEMGIENPTPETIYQQLLDDVAIHETATEKFVSQFSFYGRTLKEHSDALWVGVPKKATPEEYRAIFAELASNIQIASHYYTVSSTIYNSIVDGGSTKKADLINALAKSYEMKQRRRPGAETLAAMAESYLKDTSSVRTAAKIVKEFWKEKRDSLIEVRKCAEQIGISMHSEMKYLEHS